MQQSQKSSLSIYEKQALEDYFNAIDKDGDGTIDEFELKKILENLGVKVTRKDVMKML